MTFGGERNPLPERAKRLVLAWQGARTLGISQRTFMKALHQGVIDSYCLPQSSLLYVELQQIEARAGRPIAVRLEVNDDDAEVPTAGNRLEEITHLRKQLEVKDRAAADLKMQLEKSTGSLEERHREIAALRDSLAQLERDHQADTDALNATTRSARVPIPADGGPGHRLADAIDAKRVAQGLLRKAEEELAALAAQAEEERTRSADAVGTLLGEKMALEERVKVLEAVVENRDQSAAVSAGAVRDELGSALREKEKMESELLRLRLRVKHLAEVESSRDAAVGRLEGKVRENAALEAEVARLRARLDGLFDAEAERDRLRLELDDVQKERESIRVKLAELQVSAESIKEAEEERAELIAKLEAALQAREALEGEISPLRIELERMSQIELERNRMATELDSAQLERRVFDAEVHRIRAHTALIEEELKRYKTQEKRTARRRR